MRSPSPARSPTPGRSATPSSVASGSPRVVEEQGRAPEAYALFSPAEVLDSKSSAKLRRLEADVVDLRLDDIYQALSGPWQLDRKDVNGPHSSGDWPDETSADFWVSTDTGKVCFAAASAMMPGQYHKEVTGTWQHFPSSAKAPGNIGGFHGCCIDTAQSGSSWTLVARLADFGMVMGRDTGLRVEFAALVRNDSEALVASVGAHDECRSLFLVEHVTLPSGKLLLADPAELLEFGTSSNSSSADASDTMPRENPSSDCDGPAVPSGMGAGYYPVFISKDDQNRICRLTVVFHPGRVKKVCRRYPPSPSAASSSSTTASASSSKASKKVASAVASVEVDSKATDSSSAAYPAAATPAPTAVPKPPTNAKKPPQPRPGSVKRSGSVSRPTSGKSVVSAVSAASSVSAAKQSSSSRPSSRPPRP